MVSMRCFQKAECFTVSGTGHCMLNTHLHNTDFVVDTLLGAEVMAASNSNRETLC